MPLSLKQQAFVDAYLKEPNGTRAAVAAGYSPKTAMQAGSRLLRSVKVQEALLAQTKRTSAVAQVDAAWVLQELQALYQQAKDAQDHGPAAKCLELLGKHLVLFTENHRITVAPSEVESRLRAIFERN